MDFSTITSANHRAAMPLLRKAMTSITRFEQHDLLTAAHAGRRLKQIKVHGTKAREAHRHATGLHSHVWHEICLPVGGDCVLETADAVYALDAPAAAVIGPEMVHCERRLNSKTSHALLWFSFSKANALAGLSVHVPKNPWHTPLRWHVQGRLVSRMTASLSQVAEPGNPVWDDTAFESFRMALLALVADVYRQAMKPQREPAHRGPLGHQHEQLMQQLATFIEQHLEQPIRLEQLASIARMSPNHLNTLFKRWTGQPVHAWIVHKRMDKAMHLLQQPGKLAKQVALEVGYDDPLYFSRAFHKHHGFWPSHAKE